MRRLRWLLSDLRRVLSALRRVRAEARRVDRPLVAIACLEGAPWAVRGGANAYHLRLANEHDRPRAVGVRLRGESDAGALEASAERVLPAKDAVDLFVVTDWGARLDVVPEAPGEHLALLAPPPFSGECRLTASLVVDGVAVETLTIGQPLAR